MKQTDLVDINSCTGCMLCVSNCPRKCISVYEADGFYYPLIDGANCIDCKLCRKNCPVQKSARIDPVNVYAAQCKDLDTRKSSSSGGIFSVLGSYVLSKNGYVCGAVYNKNMNVYHDVFADEEGISKCRGSKYVQSNTLSSFSKLDEAVMHNVPVLITGTPCQIAAYKIKYSNNKNIFYVDLICHGVQSPVMWQKYIEHQKKSKGKEITDFKFRDKCAGWLNSNVRINYSDATTDIFQRKDCEYFGFFNYTRRCCYSCHFRDFNTSADITIGDYWKLEGYSADTDKMYNDDTGCSLVITNTLKGEELFKAISTSCISLRTDLQHALLTHPKLKVCIRMPRYRNILFPYLKKKDFQKTYKLFCSKNIYFIAKRKVMLKFKNISNNK